MVDVIVVVDGFYGGLSMNISDLQVNNSLKNIEKALKDNDLYAMYDDFMVLQAGFTERSRKIKGQQQTIKNMEVKLERMGYYKYGR